MTTDILPPERWAMDPGAYSGLVSAYADTIARIGYTADTTNRLVAAARHLCAWAHLTGRALEGAAGELRQDFAGHDCHCGGVRRGGPRSACYIFRVERFVRFLVSESVLTSALIGDPHAGFVAPYLDWLRHHRGLSEITVRSNAKGLRQLLPVIGADPSGWTPTTLRNAILDRRGREGRSGLKRTVTVLRSWLRYSAAMGRCDPGLVAAVPTIADWKGHHLPRGLKSADVDRLLAACDSSTPTGRRDKAILLLLVRLGLRAEDVRSLRFEQIDWTRGQIALAGKGRRTNRLPLPQEVGDALPLRVPFREGSDARRKASFHFCGFARRDMGEAERNEVVVGGPGSIPPQRYENGYFIGPTLIRHLSPGMTVWPEETFGLLFVGRPPHGLCDSHGSGSGL